MSHCVLTPAWHDSDDEAPKNADTVVINDNGTTSNGSVYTPIDDKNFYLDHVKYTVEYGHLEVSGYDDAAPNGAANIAAQVTLNGNTYAVITIGIEAFYACTGLTSITIPDNVVSLGNWCFAGCTQLTNLTLGSRLTNIGDQVFRGCPFLTAIHIKKETPIELNNTFDPAVYLSAILYIPKGYIEAYKAAEHWSTFQNIIEE